MRLWSSLIRESRYLYANESLRLTMHNVIKTCRSRASSGEPGMDVEEALDQTLVNLDTDYLGCGYFVFGFLSWIVGGDMSSQCISHLLAHSFKS